MYAEKGDYVAAAGDAAGKLYGYGKSDVLFKPTKSTKNPFRPTGESAMSCAAAPALAPTYRATSIAHPPRPPYQPQHPTHPASRYFVGSEAMNDAKYTGEDAGFTPLARTRTQTRT